MTAIEVYRQQVGPMPSSETEASTPMIDYAAPSTRQGRAEPGGWFALIWIVAIAAVAAILPSQLGSGVSRPNPLVVLAMAIVYFSGIILVVNRAARDGWSVWRSASLGMFVGLFWYCFAAQLHVIWNDPGHPRSRYRAENLQIGLCAMASLFGAILVHSRRKPKKDQAAP